MREEQILTKKARNGDSEAFGELYDRHLSPIYRFILIRVGQKTDAEDITQQVFLKAWKNIEKFETKKGAKFSSWLYKIARNSVIDHYRTSKNHAEIDSLPENLISTSHNHGESIDNSFKMDAIMKSIKNLSDVDQELIILKFIEDLPNSEISDTLNKSEVAVRVASHRALKRLKKIIEKNDEKK